MKLRVALHALEGLLNSIDIRVAAVRAEASTGTPPTDWYVWSGVLRFSSRSVEEVADRHRQLRARFRDARSGSFEIRCAALPVSLIPKSADEGPVIPILDGSGTGLAIHRGIESSAEVSRYRQVVMPWDDTPRPGFEYVYQNPGGLQPDQALVDAVAIDGEVRRNFGVSLIQIACAYLELQSRANPGNGTLYYEAEIPVRISRVRVLSNHIEVAIASAAKLEGLRAYVHRFTRDGLGIKENLPLELANAGMAGGEQHWTAVAELASFPQGEEVLECVVTHPERGVLDSFRGFIRELLPVAEQNPLLTSLRRFRDLDAEVYQPIEHPELTKHSNVRRTPALAFQAGVAQFLTLAGFQTIDLGDRDLIRAAGTKFAQGTADLLAYHSQLRLLVVGACTSNVPKGEDYDRLLNVCALLRRDFRPDGRVTLVPALFAAQHGESITRQELEAAGVRLFALEELSMLRAVIEEGHAERLLSYLTGISTNLVP